MMMTKSLFGIGVGRYAMLNPFNASSVWDTRSLATHFARGTAAAGEAGKYMPANSVVIRRSNFLTFFSRGPQGFEARRTAIVVTASRHGISGGLHKIRDPLY